VTYVDTRMAMASSSPSTSFEHRKRTFLSKDDKSSAGGIDKHCVEVCEVINAKTAFFTTSSCSGRAFLWRGDGVKSTENFMRFKVAHDLIDDADSYFDLDSLEDEEPSHQKTVGAAAEGTNGHPSASEGAGLTAAGAAASASSSSSRTCCFSGLRKYFSRKKKPASSKAVTWLRFEPFILHVACRDLSAAAALIAASRSVFKNVGLQSWTDLKYMVAIWGDEGLDMPLTSQDGCPAFAGQQEWLQSLVNERHQRNWSKIARFTAALRAMQDPAPEPGPSNGCGREEGAWEINCDDLTTVATQAAGTAGKRNHKHFDIVGDVAIFQGFNINDEDTGVEVGAILKEYPKLSIVAARSNALSTEHRRPGPLQILAGPRRTPLITTHTEFGVRYVIDLEETFFSARLAQERQRLCNVVMPGERVCVLFAGCGPEVLQLAAKTAASSIVAVEVNPVAVKCMKRSLDLLAKNMPQAAGKVEVVDGDVLQVCPKLRAGSFHRVVAPRPKLAGDGDISSPEVPGKATEFLAALLPLLAEDGVCHWYDFAADWELPECRRSVLQIQGACRAGHRSCDILRREVANRKAIAERQYRVVIDFTVKPMLREHALEV